MKKEEEIKKEIIEEKQWIVEEIKEEKEIRSRRFKTKKRK